MLRDGFTVITVWPKEIEQQPVLVQVRRRSHSFPDHFVFALQSRCLRAGGKRDDSSAGAWAGGGGGAPPASPQLRGQWGGRQVRVPCLGGGDAFGVPSALWEAGRAPSARAFPVRQTG